MTNKNLHLLLADDDIDDCDFFRSAISNISQPVVLSTVNNGVELMNFLLADQATYPDVIFLDLNMPRKSGIDCIEEIKTSEKLKHIPIIIYSTSLDRDVVNHLYELGAHYYIQKPSAFANLKSVVKKAVMLFNHSAIQRPTIENFIIQP